MVTAAARSLVPLASGLALAPLLPGVIARVKAFAAGREGPPLLQWYRDLARLARKGVVVSSVTTPLFRLGPAVAVATTAAALALVPLGSAPALASFPGDFLLLAGFLAAGRFAVMLAALDTGSSFEGMGASREAALGALAEPGLLLALAALARATGSLSLTEMAAAARGAATPLALVAAALLILLVVENARVPVDDPSTHLELTMIHEVQVLDHSGPDLALVEYGAALKLWTFAALAAGVVLPAWSGAGPAAALAGVGAIAVGIGLVESTMARLPMARVRHLPAAAAACALLALVLALRGRA